jgi:peptidyl-prolyl cis-trans isomerase A (cyclophilin A)
MRAIMETTEGRIVCRLFEKESPATVENFVGLAEGTKEFTDPVARVKAKRRYFDGTKFHRVIPSFMMQGGDPLGTGTGGPGFHIKDEFHPSLRFDRPGLLAMANAGPDTGGSQFFITQVPTPWLDSKHTIFGEVVEGQDVVDRVCRTLGSAQGRPTKEIVLKSVTIERGAVSA